MPLTSVRSDKYEFRPFAMKRHGIGSFCLAGVRPAIGLGTRGPAVRQKDFAGDGYLLRLESGFKSEMSLTDQFPQHVLARSLVRFDDALFLLAP